jgi:hypothetical protein
MSDFALMVYQKSRDKEIRRQATEIMASVERVVGQLHYPFVVGDHLAGELCRLHNLHFADAVEMQPEDFCGVSSSAADHRASPEQPPSLASGREDRLTTSGERTA